MSQTITPKDDPVSPGARTPFRGRGRIVFTLAAVLVLIGLVPMAVVAVKLIDINREKLTTSQQEIQQLKASAMKTEIDIHVESLRRQLMRMSKTLGGTIRRSGTSTELRRTLTGLIDERMPYLRYAYFSGDRLNKFDAGDLPEKLDPLFAAAPEIWAEILARQAQSRAEDAILSDPILLAEEPARVAVVVSAPVVSGGRFRGVLSALVNLQGIWESLIAENRSGHQMYAVDSEGHVVASTHPHSVQPGADLGDSPLVQRFLARRGRGDRETMPFTLMRGDREEAFIGSYAETDEGWGIIVQARSHDVYHQIQAMIASTQRWALAALVFAVLVAVLLARWLSRPIKRLVVASRTFAKGDFTMRVEEGSGNEIGELAYTFNTMADEIEDHIHKLRRAAEENRELFLDTIRALAQAIDAKDPYTRGHSERVNRYSVLIARQLGLGGKEMEDIDVASLMHDVGKIGVHDRILQKPGKLTPEEFEIMKTHTILGANIMSRIRQMKRVLPGLRWHHERWQGGGYPDGLVGKQIPLMARIIAVADTFDAITTHRPYQKAMTFPEALELLNRIKGVAFEERIVEAFNRVYNQGLIRPEAAEEDASLPTTGLPAGVGQARPELTGS